MRKIDEPDYAVYHRISKSDKGIYRAKLNPIEELLENITHSHLRKLKRVAVVPDYCGIGQGPMLPRAKFTGMNPQLFF